MGLVVMKWYSLCGVWILANLMNAKANFTFTYDMAKQCKEHLCQNGYNYETYYRVDSEDFRKIKKEADVTFQMHIAILASSNGHVLLSPIRQPTALDPVYEIVIGGGANRFTELRRNFRRNARASTKTVGILSAVEFRAFYIRITEDGLIEFGREGDILPVLSYNDVNPLTIRFFSFAAWNGVEAKFLYDCPQPGEKKSNVTPNSEAIEPQLPNSEALKRTLLLYRDPTIPPVQKVKVQLGIQINSVNYDAFQSKLTTELSMIVNWIDDSMAWYPEKFNNVTMVTLRQGQIWSPKFFVTNSDSSSMMNPKKPEPITMVNSGEATYHFQSQVVTWCVQYNVTVSKWPRDEYDCLIVIEPWEIHERLVLSPLPSKHSARELFADLDEIIQNGWDVTAKQYILNSSTSVREHLLVNNSAHQSDRYVVYLYLRRQAFAYNIIFYTPLIVLFVFVLMSFWTEPLTLTRVWFYTSTTIVICMGLCYIDVLVPIHTVPSILVFYITVLAGVLLALLIQVTLMTQLAERICKSVLIQNLLTLQCCRTLFCLPQLKITGVYESIEEIYSTPADNDSGVGITPRNGTIEEMQSDKVEYSERKEIAEILDKILFFVYTVTFAAMLSLHF